MKMENTQISSTFNEIYLLMKKHGTPTTENNLNYIYLLMDTYKLVYEVEGLTLRKLYKQPFTSLNGGKIKPVTNKVLCRTKLKKFSHVFSKLECSEIELYSIHLEVKHHFDNQII